ncbi:DNA-binding transcriptional regulator CynR [Actinomycetospora sp. NBRC 106375]|uniref:LysR family transcriptional regulator n=1 Tax=Actinomycetospora sp. NBRC 106375 TaxID=3032207 RepID=UPI0024A4993F|nr:LysR family transcriptional regulator [Actinomycetospora sp. NBRC 106375]GLZ50237.1 DNA-binding transcriptional regulator CynR [Actinomycetospora sp. NBRC 106375]
MESESRARGKSEVTAAAAANLLDTRRMFYFFHVARTGSFTAAEANLDVAQSALSRQIRQLESDLDVQLLERRGHGVELTETGKVFYDACERILGEMSDAVSDVAKAREGPRTRLSIAASRPFSGTFLPGVINRFVERFPNVQLTTFEASSGQIHEMLSGGVVDLAVVLHRPRSPKIVGAKLLDEDLLLTGRAGNPAVEGAVIPRAQLLETPLMLPAAPLGTRGILEAYFSDGGFSIEPVLRFDSVSLMKEMIRTTSFCAILPAMACEQELASGEFVARPLRPALRRSVHLAHLRDRKQTSAMRAMHEEIIASVRTAQSHPAARTGARP